MFSKRFAGVVYSIFRAAPDAAKELRSWLARAGWWFSARNIPGCAMANLDFARLEYSGPVIRLLLEYARQGRILLMARAQRPVITRPQAE
jgi:hypothetical protein